jgi:hypothetical protein
MKRWIVDLQRGRVWLAGNQHHPTRPEYCADNVADVAFVRAVDELGAFVRAKQMVEERTNA